MAEERGLWWARLAAAGPTTSEPAAGGPTASKLAARGAARGDHGVRYKRWTFEQKNSQNVKSSLFNHSHTPTLGPMNKIFLVITYDIFS